MIPTSQGNRDLYLRSNRHEFRRRDVGRKEARATARSMTFISISSRPKETGRKNPVAPLFPSRNYSRIVPPFGSRRQKCLLLLLVQIGIFFHSPRMFGSRYSFVETFSISSIYRFVPSNKPKWRRDSRAISILRMYTRRDRIESGCKEGIHEPREPCNDYYVETRWNSWRDFTYEYIKPRRSSFLVYLKGDHVFTHRRKNIARSFRACNFLIITRQIFTDRLFLYRVKECSSKVSFLFITFIPECISRFRRIYNIYICDYRLRHVRIIIRFFF